MVKDIIHKHLVDFDEFDAHDENIINIPLFNEKNDNSDKQNDTVSEHVKEKDELTKKSDNNLIRDLLNWSKMKCTASIRKCQIGHVNTPNNIFFVTAFDDNISTS